MKTAFRTVYIRLMIFFVLSSLAVGILCPSNDPLLLAAIEAGTPGAGRSPYVAASSSSTFLCRRKTNRMPAVNRLRIPVLPHVVNAGIGALFPPSFAARADFSPPATSIYSAGSAFFFGGSRVLHALAVDGYAPKFIRASPEPCPG